MQAVADEAAKNAARFETSSSSVDVPSADDGASNDAQDGGEDSDFNIDDI